MPELPEVNTVRKGFVAVALGHQIEEVQVHDDKILRNTSAIEFKRKLIGRQFVDTYRQGKYFFAKLDSDEFVLFHLGMTGDIAYYYDQEDRPKHERFNIKFKGGLILGYDDARKFSHILIIEDLEVYLNQIKLGPDALVISIEEFKKIFQNKKTSVKSVFMNQQLLSGVGNLYADEICYQAKIHPASTAGDLQERHVILLYKRMQSILKYACDQDAYYKVYPDNWFWQWRSDEGRYIMGKGTVGKIKIGGRTTYFVEGYQELISQE